MKSISRCALSHLALFTVLVVYAVWERTFMCFAVIFMLAEIHDLLNLSLTEGCRT